MYGKNQVKEMPDFIHDYNLWDEYKGHVWSGILVALNISEKASVIDLAPGASSKIEFALSNIGFKGKLFIIEPQEDVSKILYKKAKKLLPDAKIIVINKGFNDVFIAENIDAIFANHPFDDFISAYLTIEKKERDVIFDDISKEDERVLELLKSSWSASKENIEKAKNLVKKDFEDFLKRLNPKAFAFSQYSSSYFEKNNLSIINVNAEDLFRNIICGLPDRYSDEKIQNILDKNENYGNEQIGKKILNAKNWVVYGK